MAILRLFAAARDEAGVARCEIDGSRVDEVLAAAIDRFGDRFDEVVRTSRIWVNGAAAEPETPVGESDEVAILPPVSGG